MDPLSRVSYIANAYRDLDRGPHLGQGTVGVVRIDDRLALVTARHVLVDKSYETRRIDTWDVGNPRCIGLMVPKLDGGRIVAWEEALFRLYDDKDRRLWREVLHPDSEAPMDVAVIDAESACIEKHFPTLSYFPFDLADNRLDLRPSEPISIVGFPWGKSAIGKEGHLAIWKTGFLASDLAVSWEGWPAFIVDATATSGMSGSPVFAVRRGAFSADPSGNGVRLHGNGGAYQYLGVYAGKIAKDKLPTSGEAGGSINIGLVWRPEVVKAAWGSPAPAEGG